MAALLSGLLPRTPLCQRNLDCAHRLAGEELSYVEPDVHQPGQGISMMASYFDCDGHKQGTKQIDWAIRQHIYYAISSRVEGPFSLNSTVTIDPRDFSKGLPVPGGNTRSDKIVEFRDTADGKIKVKFERV
ncbi:MAG TPA: hypothetical protein VGB46_00855 [Flavisolibacter sp.]|jgi:hypothetical protein